jgi:antitoxin YobK
MAGIDEIKSLMKSANVAGGVTVESIDEAELALGVQFPKSYRTFLSEFGAALCTGFEIDGLFGEGSDDEPPLWTHVVTNTLRLRRASRGAIPNAYIAISDNGGDHKFYLDTSRRNDQGECPVIALGPGVDGVVVAEDFFEFLVRSFSATLQY